MPRDSYSWTKTYVIHTSADDNVVPGDTIFVNSRDGGSKQEVLSVTTKNNKDGDPYNVLIVAPAA